MKLFLAHLFVVLSSFCFSQTTLIPDPNFEQALIDLGHDSGPIDGSIPTGNISWITILDVSNKNITDLTGIQDFTALTYLSVSNNLLINLDVTQNNNLVTLNFGYNQLVNVNLTQNVNLIDLRCEVNQLNSINVTQNISLQTLICFDNLLTSIDLTQNVNLVDLRCEDNQLISINTTQNVNLEDFTCINNQLTSIDVTQNINLQHLLCSYNQLTSIDVAQNVNLESLICGNNQITNIDVALNPNLSTLQISDNPIIDIDVTQNPNLSNLHVNNIMMTDLDVSQNPNLLTLACQGNQLTNLDVSQNPNLFELRCQNNQLSCLSLGGYTDTLSIWHNFTNNPDLFCINTYVPTLALTNLQNRDPWTTFSQNCLCDVGANAIHGNIKTDSSGLCVGGLNLPLAVVHTSDGNFDITDGTGNFTLYADSGTVDIHQLPVTSHPLFVQQLCPNTPSYYTETFTGTGLISTGNDFYNDFYECPMLVTAVTSNARRRCFNNTTIINYCNIGITDTSNVKVFLELPPYVVLQTASMPFVLTSEGFYEFTIGDLDAGECGLITVVDSVVCINGILGEEQCTRSWITPKNECLYNYTNNSSWSGAELSIYGSCQNDTLVSYTISNVGTGNMTSYSHYRLYEDGILIHVDSVILNSGGSGFVTIPATSEEYRLEVDQVSGYPIITNPSVVVKSCSAGGSQQVYNSARPNEDGDHDIGTQCLPIIGSYDPNDKNFSPNAFGPSNYIAPGTEMDYTIRFQNTGTDTAFTVVITDTISDLLDLSTFRLLGNLDPVVVDIIGDSIPVLKFTFPQINLPDSATNLMGSQGFVRFELSPIPGLPLGTEVHNEANIYFDYNAPILTNDSWYTIYDTIPTSGNVVLEVIEEDLETLFSVYPNPTNGDFMIKFNSVQPEIHVEVLNSLGQQVAGGYYHQTNSIQSTLIAEPGVYFLRIDVNGKSLVRPLIKHE
ncbi:MAG: T9SS type A sorting domain-containing protein [Crocinitomicaceae bacterium]|nr:T9SS type A sorting domain-containing protein [Crocinitomicaceae bacterium]